MSDVEADDPIPYYTEGLAEDCGYDENEDTGMDSLIDYKNALEETLDSIEAAIRNTEGVTLTEWLTRNVAG